MNAETLYAARPPKPRFGQFTLRTLFIGVALLCVVLGWRQMQRQYAFDLLWNLASNKRTDYRFENDIGEAMYRLMPRENIDPYPCFISRIDERKHQLAIVQAHMPVDPRARSSVRLTVLNRFGRINSMNACEIGPELMAIDDAQLEISHDGSEVIKLRILNAAKPAFESLILVVERGKIKQMSHE